MCDKNQPIKQLNGQMQAQSGYVLILTAMFLLILMGTSTQFYTRSLENTRLSGVERDKDLSFLTAEAAMNDLYLRVANGLYSNTLPLNISPLPPACPDGPSATACFLGLITPNLANSAALDPQLPSYIYYMSAGNGIDTAVPGILQGIANGESQNTAVSATTAGSFATVNAGTNLNLRIDDLYTNTKNPISYRLNANTGALTPVAVPASFTNMGNIGGGTPTESGVKAAAWLEFAPAAGGGINIYVQAIAQAGTAMTYLQQLISAGSVRNILGDNISAIAEAENR